MTLHPGSQTAQYLGFTGNFIPSKPVMPDLVTLGFKGLVMPTDDLVQPLCLQNWTCHTSYLSSILGCNKGDYED